MSTFNGIGTALRGWNHQTDGTAFATEWFVLVYLPVLPLHRFHVRTLTDFEHEPFVPPPVEGGWLQGGFSWSDPVDVLARLPLSWSEIGRTYGRAYLLVPLLLLWPIAIVRLGTAGYRWHVGDPLAPPPAAWPLALGLVALVNLIAVLVVGARRPSAAPWCAGAAATASCSRRAMAAAAGACGATSCSGRACRGTLGRRAL